MDESAGSCNKIVVRWHSTAHMLHVVGSDQVRYSAEVRTGCRGARIIVYNGTRMQPTHKSVFSSSALDHERSAKEGATNSMVGNVDSTQGATERSRICLPRKIVFPGEVFGLALEHTDLGALYLLIQVLPESHSRADFNADVEGEELVKDLRKLVRDVTLVHVQRVMEVYHKTDRLPVHRTRLWRRVARGASHRVAIVGGLRLTNSWKARFSRGRLPLGELVPKLLDELLQVAFGRVTSSSSEAITSSMTPKVSKTSRTGSPEGPATPLLAAGPSARSTQG